MEEVNDSTIKLAVSGLDNAGKTSFLTVLEKMYGFEEIVKFLKPTLGVHYTKRDYFGQSIMYWDFGGQEEFREKYLRNRQYFVGTDLIYYLIDIQDEDRFKDSVDYLGHIVEILQENGEQLTIPIHICFSKSDYDLIKDKAFDYPGKVAMIHKLLETSYPDFKFRFHYTSIYEIMSIISVHVRSMREVIPIFKDLDIIISNFAGNNPLMRVVITDHTGLPFVNYTSTDYWLDQRQPKIDKMLSYQLQLFRQIEEKGLKVNEAYDELDDFHTYYLRFKADKMSENVVTIESIFEEFFGDDEEEMEDKILEGEKSSNYYLIIYSSSDTEKLRQDKINNLIVELKTLFIKFEDIFT